MGVNANAESLTDKMVTLLKIFAVANLFLCIKSACQCNNYLDKTDVLDVGMLDIDTEMGQCKGRTNLGRECGIWDFQGWCYVDDSNNCSDSKLSTEGAPFNWSCQACHESEKPYPPPVTTTPLPRIIPDKESSAASTSVAAVVALLAVLVLRKRSSQEKEDDTPKTEFNHMYG